MQQRRTEARGKREDPWVWVSSWPPPSRGQQGLEPTAKVTWAALYKDAGGVDRDLRIRVSNVSLDAGLPERSIRRALEALAKVGLISIRDRFRGEIVLSLHDPERARRAWERSMKLTSAANSGQGELFPIEPQLPCSESEAGPPVVRMEPPPAEPPANVAETAVQTSEPPFRIKHKNRDLDYEALSIQSIDSARARLECETAVQASEPPQLPTKADWDRLASKDLDAFAKIAGEAREQSHPRTNPPTVGQALVETLKNYLGPEQRASEAQQLVAWMRKRLADQDFFDGYYGEIAWAIIDGNSNFSEKHVLRILDRLDRMQRLGRLDKARGAYFLGAIRREMQTHGLKLQVTGAKVFQNRMPER